MPTASTTLTQVRRAPIGLKSGTLEHSRLSYGVLVLRFSGDLRLQSLTYLVKGIRYT
jgi:hypothetical protein